MKATQETIDSVFTMFYLLYKLNIVTRDHLKAVIRKWMVEEAPESISEYLTQEVKKTDPIRR